MNHAEMNETVGVLEALAIAVQDRDTWYRVAAWNGAQKVPYAAVADLLRQLKPDSANNAGSQEEAGR